MSPTKKKAKKKAVRRGRAKTAAATSTSRLDRIQELGLKHQTASAYEKDVKKEKSELAGELMEIMRALDAKKVEIGTVRVSAVETAGRQALDEMKLLKAGVSAKTIAKCKTRGKPSHSIRVSELETPRELALIVTEEEVA